MLQTENNKKKIAITQRERKYEKSTNSKFHKYLSQFDVAVFL